jgi:tetratricopeptide (TPR) repeat protein
MYSRATQLSSPQEVRQRVIDSRMGSGRSPQAGNRVRVNAQLIDAESDAHLWAERFDGDMDDLFALQDEITSRIAIALNLELISTEAARMTERPDALDYIFRGRASISRPPSRDNYAEAISLFERALTFDPRSVEAKGWLAAALAGRVIDQMSDSAAADITRGEGLAGGALATSPRNPLAHWAKGHVLRAQNRFDEAIAEYETVIALDRNRVGAYAHIGQCKFYKGSIEEYIPLVERVLRLSPRDPLLSVWFGRIGLVHLLQSRIAEAILWLEKARNADPALAYVRSRLASAYALNGEIERAAAELGEARRLSREDRYSSIARLRVIENLGVPKIRALFEATFFAGLRKAGMPEE